jgi:hypothetical protein
MLLKETSKHSLFGSGDPLVKKAVTVQAYIELHLVAAATCCIFVTVFNFDFLVEFIGLASLAISAQSSNFCLERLIHKSRGREDSSSQCWFS